MVLPSRMAMAPIAAVEYTAGKVIQKSSTAISQVTEQNIAVVECLIITVTQR
jgi:hypothetical protein